MGRSRPTEKLVSKENNNPSYPEFLKHIIKSSTIKFLELESQMIST